MLMTTIPFSYPPKWVIADLYLYCAVLSTNFQDLNNNNDWIQSRKDYSLFLYGRMFWLIVLSKEVLFIICFALLTWRGSRLGDVGFCFVTFTIVDSLWYNHLFWSQKNKISFWCKRLINYIFFISLWYTNRYSVIFS